MNNSGGLPLIFICTSHDEGAAANGGLKQAVSCVHKSANLPELQHAIRKHDSWFRVFLNLKFVFRWDSQIMKWLHLRQVLQ